jgi:hypothetical protein
MEALNQKPFVNPELRGKIFRGMDEFQKEKAKETGKSTAQVINMADILAQAGVTATAMPNYAGYTSQSSTYEMGNA